MYFPFLRGQQAELLALRSLAQKLGANSAVHPIIEPVNPALGPLNTALIELSAHGGRAIVIMNPSVGNPIDPSTLIALAKTHARAIWPAFLLWGKATSAEADTFAKAFAGMDVVLIHASDTSVTMGLAAKIQASAQVKFDVFLLGNVSDTYIQEHGKANRILIADGFRKADRNADYPEEEHFSDLRSRYTEHSAIGYGDFTVVGERHREGGGRSHAVALHVTYHDGPATRIKHFVSAPIHQSAPAAVQYADAVALLATFASSDPKVAHTLGLNNFKTTHYLHSFPGLGKAKEYAVAHHIELHLPVA